MYLGDFKNWNHFVYFLPFKDISLMGEMYLKTPQEQAETPEKEAEQGLQKTVEEPQTVKSLIKILPAYIKVIVCLLLLECLSIVIISSNLYWKLI
jgi:hypothetical protein